MGEALAFIFIILPYFIVAVTFSVYLIVHETGENDSLYTLHKNHVEHTRKIKSIITTIDKLTQQDVKSLYKIIEPTSDVDTYVQIHNNIINSNTLEDINKSVETVRRWVRNGNCNGIPLDVLINYVIPYKQKQLEELNNELCKS